MNENGPVFCDFLEVDDELIRIVFSKREKLGAIQSKDVVGDNVDSLRLEVRVVYTQIRVEPVHLDVSF